jgi:hypothetical protein
VFVFVSVSMGGCRWRLACVIKLVQGLDRRQWVDRGVVRDEGIGLTAK